MVSTADGRRYRFRSARTRRDSVWRRVRRDTLRRQGRQRQAWCLALACIAVALAPSWDAPAMPGMVDAMADVRHDPLRIAGTLPIAAGHAAAPLPPAQRGGSADSVERIALAAGGSALSHRAAGSGRCGLHVRP